MGVGEKETERGERKGGRGEREREREGGGGRREREGGEHPIVAHLVFVLTSGSSDSKGKCPLVFPQETYNLPCSTPAVQNEVKNT